MHLFEYEMSPSTGAGGRLKPVRHGEYQTSKRGLLKADQMKASSAFVAFSGHNKNSMVQYSFGAAPNLVWVSTFGCSREHRLHSREVS